MKDRLVGVGFVLFILTVMTTLITASFYHVNRQYDVTFLDGSIEVHVRLRNDTVWWDMHDNITVVIVYWNVDTFHDAWIQWEDTINASGSQKLDHLRGDDQIQISWGNTTERMRLK